MIKIAKFLLGIIFILICFTILSISQVDLSKYNITPTYYDGRNGNYDLPWATYDGTKIASSVNKKRINGGTSSTSSRSDGTTKIVAIADIRYSRIALDWYQQLSNLGYTTHVIVAADDRSISFFQRIEQERLLQAGINTNTNITTQTSKSTNTNIIRVEPLIDPTSPDWPVAAGRLQQLRRKIFATRWVYILGQLKNGHHILLTDVDAIFVQYIPMSVMEDSDYDVYHSHCNDYPVRFLSMGFVVCGTMVWLRSSVESVRYVESILEQCGWGGMEEEDGAEGYRNAANISHNDSAATASEFLALGKYSPPVLPMKAKVAKCDDQQVINSKFFFNTLNYTWDTNKNNMGKPRVEDGFWKNEASGKSLVTGHRFKIWSVDTCYRGSVDGSDEGRCPDSKVNWVAMPSNTIYANEADIKLNKAIDRKLRFEQWYRLCRNETK